MTVIPQIRPEPPPREVQRKGNKAKLGFENPKGVLKHKPELVPQQEVQDKGRSKRRRGGFNLKEIQTNKGGWRKVKPRSTHRELRKKTNQGTPRNNKKLQPTENTSNELIENGTLQFSTERTISITL